MTTCLCKLRVASCRIGQGKAIERRNMASTGVTGLQNLSCKCQVILQRYA